jgi:hypothetical protein
MAKKAETVVTETVNLETIKAEALKEAQALLIQQAEAEKEAKDKEAKDKAEALNDRLKNAIGRLALTCQRVGNGKSETLNALNSVYLSETVSRLQQSVKTILICQIVENASLCLEKDLIQSEVEEKQGAKRKEKLLVKNNPKALAYSLLVEMQSVIIKEEKVRKQASAFTYF